jgi:hypothetical protein
MSQQMVGIVISSLLADEELRIRFVTDPIETLAALNVRGVELTPEEFEALVLTDVRLWFWSRVLFGMHVH